jgi:hypothetical protein
MDKQARERSYPKYLYRAHVHGHRSPDYWTIARENIVIASAPTFIFGPNMTQNRKYSSPYATPMEFNTVDDFFSELNLHLDKTHVSFQRKRGGEEPFLSFFVSLSGDFRWTAQRICRVGRMASKDQIPGLALFKTSTIDPSVVRI